MMSVCFNSKNNRCCPIAFARRLVLALSGLVLVATAAHAQDFVWARSMGGTVESEIAIAIAVDGDGNVYTTGSFGGTADFDPGPGTFNLTSAGSVDVFVSKLDSDGDFVWARSMGGGVSDVPQGIAVDGDGNVYTTGRFDGTADFDPGAGTFNLASAGGGASFFVRKLDSAGNFVWASSVGPATRGVFRVVPVDGDGNVYAAGAFIAAADFDPGAGTFNLTPVGERDIFVWKLDSAGNLVWASSMGGPGVDEAQGIAIDGSGNVYTTGRFDGTADFDPGPGTFNLTSAGQQDIFVSKLDSAGNFVWARRMGGGSMDVGRGIAVDGDGNVYTSGQFKSTVDFDPGPGTFNLTSAGNFDIFISKLEPSDSVVIGVNPIVGPGTVFEGGVVIGDNAQIGSNVQFKQGVRVGDNVVIGDETIIEAFTVVGNDVVLGFKVKIEENVLIGDRVGIGVESVIKKDAIVMDDASIGAFVTIGDGAIIEAGAMVADGEVVPAGATVSL